MIRFLLFTLFLLLPLSANALLIERKLSYASGGAACDPITGADFDVDFACGSYSGSGTAVTDLASTTDFTINGNPVYTTDSYFTLDGTGDYFAADSIPDADIAASTGGDYVFGAVIRAPSTISATTYLYGFYESSTEYHRLAMLSTAVMRFSARAASSITNSASATSISTSTDYCIVLAVDNDNGDVTYYINSTTGETVTGTFVYGGTQTGVTAMQIGADGNGGAVMENTTRIYGYMLDHDKDYTTVDATYVAGLHSTWEARHTGLDCTP